MPGASRKRGGATAPARPARRPAPRALTLSSGVAVPLDGDVVYLIDALYRDFAVKRGFAPAYPELQREIGRVVAQMGAKARAEYFAASLFLNYVTYENEMAERLAETITRRARRSARRR